MEGYLKGLKDFHIFPSWWLIILFYIFILNMLSSWIPMKGDRHFGALNTFNNLLWNYEIDTIVYRPGIDYGCGACLVINIVFFYLKCISSTPCYSSMQVSFWNLSMRISCPVVPEGRFCGSRVSLLICTFHDCIVTGQGYTDYNIVKIFE